MDDPFAIRDIAPPVESLSTAGIWPWLFFALLLTSIVIYKLTRKTRPESMAPKPVPQPTPLESALSALDSLLSEKLIEKGRTKLFFTKLNMLLRIFLASQLKAQALLQTTSELLASDVFTRALDDDCRSLFAAFLAECDLFKFADITAQSNIARTAHDTCRALIIRVADATEAR